MARELSGGFVVFIVVCFLVFVLAFFWCFFINTCCGQDIMRAFCHSCCPGFTRWWRQRRRGRYGQRPYQTASIEETFYMTDHTDGDDYGGEFEFDYFPDSQEAGEDPYPAEGSSAPIHYHSGPSKAPSAGLTNVSLAPPTDRLGSNQAAGSSSPNPMLNESPEENELLINKR
ncbi:hypothetical protein H4R33_001664 [Dimargaris cristalligena]|uniref:Uncharacterized protein n=1 Tax=Dimargaris cristalligena TaxID=215637 RepID=A0A4P9ZY51_9FUNG|nr:hypothetical protein H4R33_001664 [Dimargaris cristalligena]RKP38634.1 hypothetical protein BJ085DRAFT_34016 [Dimargaris cristalligena]|eukprot:RKP38634.1 hypothetical protein BJ085DRAFT_34016 [Dimargaris cristalligena]